MLVERSQRGTLTFYISHIYHSCHKSVTFRRGGVAGPVSGWWGVKQFEEIQYIGTKSLSETLEKGCHPELVSGSQRGFRLPMEIPKRVRNDTKEGLRIGSQSSHFPSMASRFMFAVDETRKKKE